MIVAKWIMDRIGGGHYSTERTGPERTGTQHYSTERTTRPQALKCLGTMSASRRKAASFGGCKWLSNDHGRNRRCEFRVPV